MTTPEARLQRLCDVCGKLDDHPRHVTGVPPDFPGAVPDNAFLDSLSVTAPGAPARAIAELLDPSTIVRHMDCCGSRGCKLCQDVLAAAGSAHGDALVTALESGVADHLSGSQPELRNDVIEGEIVHLDSPAPDSEV